VKWSLKREKIAGGEERNQVNRKCRMRDVIMITCNAIKVKKREVK